MLEQPRVFRLKIKDIEIITIINIHQKDDKSLYIWFKNIITSLIFNLKLWFYSYF